MDLSLMFWFNFSGYICCMKNQCYMLPKALIVQKSLQTYCIFSYCLYIIPKNMSNRPNGSITVLHGNNTKIVVCSCYQGLTVRATQVLCLITNSSAHCCIVPTLLLPPHFSLPKAGPLTLPVQLLLFSLVTRWVESEPQPLILWKQDSSSGAGGEKRGTTRCEWGQMGLSPHLS